MSKGLFTCLNINGDKNKKEMKIRSAATSSLEYTSKPRFINMKELPHINASVIRMIQLKALLFTTKIYRAKIELFDAHNLRKYSFALAA